MASTQPPTPPPRSAASAASAANSLAPCNITRAQDGSLRDIQLIKLTGLPEGTPVHNAGGYVVIRWDALLIFGAVPKNPCKLRVMELLVNYYGNQYAPLQVIAFHLLHNLGAISGATSIFMELMYDWRMMLLNLADASSDYMSPIYMAGLRAALLHATQSEQGSYMYLLTEINTLKRKASQIDWPFIAKIGSFAFYQAQLERKPLENLSAMEWRSYLSNLMIIATVVWDGKIITALIALAPSDTTAAKSTVKRLKRNWHQMYPQPLFQEKIVTLTVHAVFRGDEPRWYEQLKRNPEARETFHAMLGASTYPAGIMREAKMSKWGAKLMELLPAPLEDITVQGISAYNFTFNQEAYVDWVSSAMCPPEHGMPDPQASLDELRKAARTEPEHEFLRKCPPDLLKNACRTSVDFLASNVRLATTIDKNANVHEFAKLVVSLCTQDTPIREIAAHETRDPKLCENRHRGVFVRKLMQIFCNEEAETGLRSPDYYFLSSQTKQGIARVSGAVLTPEARWNRLEERHDSLVGEADSLRILLELQSTESIRPNSVMENWLAEQTAQRKRQWEEDSRQFIADYNRIETGGDATEKACGFCEGTLAEGPAVVVCPNGHMLHMRCLQRQCKRNRKYCARCNNIYSDRVLENVAGEEAPEGPDADGDDRDDQGENGRTLNAALEADRALRQFVAGMAEERNDEPPQAQAQAHDLDQERALIWWGTLGVELAAGFILVLVCKSLWTPPSELG